MHPARYEQTCRCGNRQNTPVLRSCRIEGVACPYTYVLDCISLTATPIVNSPMSFVPGARLRTLLDSQPRLRCG